MNQACKFYLVRHGETEWNKLGIMQGHQDSALTTQGRSQAKLAADKLKDVVFAHGFSSDLLRARHTAEIIAAEKDLAIKTSQLLREIRLGPFEGKKKSYFRKRLRKSLAYRESLAANQRGDYQLHPQIETFNEVASRMIRFLRETAIAYPNKNVLVVSHSIIMRSALIKLGFANHDELTHGSIENSGYAVVESDGVEFEVIETSGINKK